MPHVRILLAYNRNKISIGKCGCPENLCTRQSSRLKSSMPFNCDVALQIYTSLKTTFQNATPNWQWRCHLESSVDSAGTRTNKRRALSILVRSWVRWLILDSSHCTWKHVPHNSCTNLVPVLYFISIFMDWRLGFEPALQLKSWNLRALQNETRTRASILNIGTRCVLSTQHIIACHLWTPTMPNAPFPPDFTK